MIRNVQHVLLLHTKKMMYCHWQEEFIREREYNAQMRL